MHKISFEIMVRETLTGDMKGKEWRGYNVDGTPGLGVCKTPRHLYDSTWQEGPGWQIIHLDSGFRVGPRVLDRRKDALELATMLGDICDWTLPGKKVVKFANQIVKMIEQFQYSVR